MPFYLREEDRPALNALNARMGYSEQEVLMIVVSSFRAQDKLRTVKVKHDPHSQEATLYSGDGTELITLEAKQAASLYTQLAVAYDWPHADLCPDCQEELDDSECGYCGWTPNNEAQSD
jgi:hypothetical protein